MILFNLISGNQASSRPQQMKMAKKVGLNNASHWQTETLQSTNGKSQILLLANAQYLRTLENTIRPWYYAPPLFLKSPPHPPLSTTVIPNADSRLPPLSTNPGSPFLRYALSTVFSA